MNSLDNYLKYRDSDEDFSFILRMEYEWDDKQYQILMSKVRDILYEYKDELVLPKTIIHFFTSEIDIISGTVSNDVFFTTTPDGISKEDYKKLVLKRKSELLELKKMFFSGDFSHLGKHSFFL
ncbi:MAG: hypothetical protein HWE22_15185 [Flavobacteriales bacterium]|nr:hypothetical protein [Flavobacteriales bacterium]